MARKLTFIHTADLHLGAPLRGLRALSEKWAQRVSSAIPAAFDILVETALEREVDFVVIAGDIFDQAQPSYANYMRFASGLERLHAAGIPTYLCTGNHDPYTSWRSDLVDLPPSAYMFAADKPSFTVFERGGEPLALLGGRGFFNQVFDDTIDISEGITRQAAEHALGVSAPFGIGVLHTGLNLDPNKAPTKPGTLLQSGMDYWALGHIHLPWVNDETDPHIVFSGCIQGRDVNETGPRGCYVVTLEEGKPNKAEFVPLSSVVWQLLDIDVSTCTTISDAQATIMKALFAANGQAQCDYMVERIRLVGRTPLHRVLQEPNMLADLREHINAAHPTFFCDSLRDATTAELSKDALLAEGLFPAVLINCANELNADEPATQTFIQDAFASKNLRVPHTVMDSLATMQEDACESALDILQCGVQ